MSVQVETLEKNMAKLTIELSVDKLEGALQQVYMQQRNKIQLPGFRKGKAPRTMVEKMFGPEIFFEDAANQLIRENYGEAAEESGVDIVSRPEIDIVQMEKGKPCIFTAEVAVRPEVELGKYKGVTVTKIDVSVSDEEIDKAIEEERNQNARIVTVEDRPAQNGDTVIIDFEGFVDGEAFEGGKGEGHSLELGSHSFIDTFEDQLAGKSAGEETEVHVTFPEEYHAEELAGKPAVFQVKIQEIKTKELPELDDEFAQDVSEFDTLAEYRESVQKKIAEQKEADAKRTKEEEAIKKIVDKSNMEIPDAMLATQIETMIEEFAQRISGQGLSFEQYLQFSGMTMEKLKEQVKPDALSRIQNGLVLEQIAKEENIEVTEEELDAEIEKMAASYQVTPDQIKTFMNDSERDSMKKDVAVQKAVELVMANIKERAKPKSKKEEA